MNSKSRSTREEDLLRRKEESFGLKISLLTSAIFKKSFGLAPQIGHDCVRLVPVNVLKPCQL